jgi:predicted transcriptional regulator
VSNNSLPVAELPTLIASVHAALSGLTSGTSQAPAEEVEKPTPSQIRKSITPGGLISFIDGKPYKTLKRHLAAHGLDPHSYRERYGLPRDYPMVAANYAAQRADLARAIGLGRPGAMAEGSQPGRRSRKGA